MTLAEYVANPCALIQPSYVVHHYTDQIYKIVHFKRPRSLVERSKKVDRSKKGYGEKLDAAISRAKRVVLEVALCNRWDYFCTFTLDQTKYDRYNLKVWYKDFTQWIRDQRKKTGHKIRYLLIPELHQDGAWHMHGLFFDVPETISFAELRYIYGWKLPDKLIKGNYRCWMDYHKKFGSCSLGALKNPVAAGFYISKYISKSLQETNIAVGGHLYYASHGLMRSAVQVEIYEETDAFDRWLTNKYEFIETGFTHVEDGLTWTFALEYDRIQPLDQAYAGDLIQVEEEMDGYFEAVEGIQLTMDGFELPQ